MGWVAHDEHGNEIPNNNHDNNHDVDDASQPPPQQPRPKQQRSWMAHDEYGVKLYVRPTNVAIEDGGTPADHRSSDIRNSSKSKSNNTNNGHDNFDVQSKMSNTDINTVDEQEKQDDDDYRQLSWKQQQQQQHRDDNKDVDEILEIRNDWKRSSSSRSYIIVSKLSSPSSSSRSVNTATETNNKWFGFCDLGSHHWNWNWTCQRQRQGHSRTSSNATTNNNNNNKTSSSNSIQSSTIFYGSDDDDNGGQNSLPTTTTTNRRRRNTLLYLLFCVVLMMIIALSVGMGISQLNKNKRIQEQEEQNNQLDSSAADASTTGGDGSGSGGDTSTDLSNSQSTSNSEGNAGDDNDDIDDKNSDPCEDSIKINKLMCYDRGETIYVEFQRCQNNSINSSAAEVGADWIGLFPAWSDSNSNGDGTLYPNEIYWAYVCNSGNNINEDEQRPSTACDGSGGGTVEFTAQLNDGKYQIFLVSGTDYPYRPIASTNEFNVKEDCYA